MLDVLLAVGAVFLTYQILQQSQGGGDATEFLLSGDTSTDAGAGSDLSNSSGGVMASLSDWANAIFHHEGGKAGDLNVRNSNPGNLKYTGQPGAIGADSRGFAVFSSMQAGWDALAADLQAKVNKYPDYSILQIMTRYLGGNVNNPQVTSEGNPFTYANSVANALGVSIDTKLRDIFG